MKAKTQAAGLVLRNPKGNLSTLTVEYRDEVGGFKRQSTGIKVVNSKDAKGEYKYFDATTNTIRAKGSQNPGKDTEEAREVLAEVNDYIAELKRQLKRWPLVSELSAAKAAAEAPAPAPQETPLADVMQSYIDNRSGIQPATRKSFQTLLHNIKSYEDVTGTTWLLSSLTNPEIRKFQQWQIDTYNYKNSTAGKRTRLLRQFLSEHPAPQVTLAKIKPLDSVLLTAPVVLTQNEIEALRALELSPTSRLGKVRNLQILQIFTGLRVSDLMRLGREHVIGNQIIIREKKTNQTRRIPILPPAREILNTYTDALTGEIHLPSISEQKFNDYIAELANIYLADSKVLITRKHREKITEIWEPKAEHITSHSSRRSFCSLFLSLGYSIRETMNFSGHKSLASFSRYMGHLETQADASQEFAARYAAKLSV